MSLIPDKEIEKYIDRILEAFKDEQFSDLSAMNTPTKAKSGLRLLHLDSEQKRRLGRLWASKVGNNYRHFMIYERQTAHGAYKSEDFLDITKDI